MALKIFGKLLMLMLIVAMSDVAGVHAQEDPPTLTQAIARLAGAQADLQGATAAAGLSLPGGLSDVLIVRRTIAADWKQRLDNQAIKPDDAGLLRFTQEIHDLAGNLDEVANLARELAEAPRLFSRCLNEAVYVRYRTLVSDAFTHALQAVVAGRFQDRLAPAGWSERRARYTTLLSLIEAQQGAAEKYALLPADDRWLSEYREHLRLVRATLEPQVDQSEHRDSDQHQAVLDVYTQLLDVRVQQLQRLSSCGLPDTTTEVVTYRRAGALQTAALERLIGLARTRLADDDEHWRREQQENRLLMHAIRLTDQADRWLSFAVERREQATQLTEQLADAPAAVAGLMRAVLDDSVRAHQSAQVAFAQAVAASDVAAALAATHAVERARQQTDRRLMYLEQDGDLGVREKAWRVHAADPAIAEKLREWDKRWAVFVNARRAADEAADAALLASQAIERAQLASEAADEHAQSTEDEVDQHELSELIEALEEMVDLRAGNAPEQ